MSACAVCGAAVEEVYRSDAARSLTSLCTVLDQPTVVLWCPSCGHLQTPPIGDLDAYYASAYRILIESEEEDQIHAVVDGQPVFRADHQAATYLAMVDLPPDARVLDYGAAKGATMRKVRETRPDIALHYFDVSDMYVDFWRRIVDDSSFATFTTPASWAGAFDVVSSFFMLEHVEHPQEVVAAMRDLVAPGGTVYAVVPDPFVNVGDFVVVDHTNHFTSTSLAHLFLGAGLEDVRVDDSAHAGAWVVLARRPVDERSTAAPVAQDELEAIRARAHELATYWRSARQHVVDAEASLGDGAVAIYGAGFYGSYVRANLAHPDAVVAYVDQNPHLQGTEHEDRPVVSPADLDPAVTDVLVGLNPIHARAIIGDIAAWHGRPLAFHYL